MLSGAQKIIYTDALSSTNLLDIFENRAIALVIKKYYSSEICSELTKKCIGDNIEHYENAPSIGRYGMAYYETEGVPERLNKYYTKSITTIKDIRKLFSPYISPMDKLRLDLEEEWQYGANIQNIDNKKMFVGLLRLLEPNVDFLPHQDIFHLDAISNDKARELKAQIAANIYIKTPNNGGELNLWSYGFHDYEYNEKLDTNSYGISRNKLPEHSISIKPESGDLILFNSRVLHAIKPGNSTRISLSCFIGFKDITSPLVYWS